MVRLVIVLLLLPVVACGGSSPSAPSTFSDRVRLTEGQYRFAAQMNPFDARYPACSGSLLVPPPSGITLILNVGANAVLRYDEGEWVARPETPADGDFELRFRDTGGTAPQVGAVPVRGSVRGLLSPRGNDTASTKQFASFTGSVGAAEVDGAVLMAGTSAPPLPYSLVRGIARGEIAFWLDPGGRSTCQMVDWSLMQFVER